MRRFLALALLVLATCALAAAPAWADAPIYYVQYGDTLFSIAQHYGVSVEALRAANGLYGNLIYAGQALTIPTGNGHPAPPSGSTVAHVAQYGETLFSIGLRYGLQWTVIAQANGLVGDGVYAGQTLIIPLGGNTAPTPSPTAPPAPTVAPSPTAAPTQPPAPNPEPTPSPASTGETTHVVLRGETLFSIGLRYGLPWTVIAQANGIIGDRVYAGQTLTIPANFDPNPHPTPPPGGALEGRYFLVDLSAQTLYAYEGRALVRSTLISSGVWPYPTVVGAYDIYLRYTSQTMFGPGYYLPDVPYVQYFYQGYALHGTYWHNNFGAPMSHGCVNLPTSEAEWAFNWAGIGTPVIVQW